MTEHFKKAEIQKLVSAGIATMLTGEKGSGKTTIAMDIAKTLNLHFYSISMTRQTTLSHLLGFVSVNGTYIESQLYKAATCGGLFLLDEIDAADANVILSLNTIENGYISFPTGVVQIHKDFRMVATANPQDEHHHYVGRSRLDAATLDRFDIVIIPLDLDLEKSLVDTDTSLKISALRHILKQNNSSKSVSMRDSLRYYARKHLNLTEGFFERIIGDNPNVLQEFQEAVSSMPKFIKQSDCETVHDLVELIGVQ
jgi:MoxR-like ATPase